MVYVATILEQLAYRMCRLLLNAGFYNQEVPTTPSSSVSTAFLQSLEVPALSAAAILASPNNHASSLPYLFRPLVVIPSSPPPNQ